MTDTGSEVVKVTAKPVIPDELHGFAVTVGLGPYPPHQPDGRQAVYAELVPMTQKTLDAMHHTGKSRILGIVPVTPEAAMDIQLEPGGRLAEQVSVRALAEAARLARPIHDS